MKFYMLTFLIMFSVAIFANESISPQVKLSYTEAQLQNKKQFLSTVTQSKLNLVTNLSAKDFELNIKQFEAQILNIQDLSVFEKYLDGYFNQVDAFFQDLTKVSDVGIKNMYTQLLSGLSKIKPYNNEQIRQMVQKLNIDQKQAQWLFSKVKDHYIYRGEDFCSQNQLKWKKIFQSNIKPVQKVDYVVPTGRWMFQAWTPQNDQQKNNLNSELQYVKNRGYIGVVVCWDGKSDYNKLVQVQQLILSKGLKVWLAFSPLKTDSLKLSTFVQPQYFAKGLGVLSVRSQAFIMGWRRTSIHLNLQNQQWQNYTMQALRSGNPKIGFIGQAYYGYNGTDSSEQYHLYVNYRDNYNAVLAVNFGFLSVSPRWAKAKLRTKIKDNNCQYICLIQGITATYLTGKSNLKQRSKVQYRRINQSLQRRFLRNGFVAVAGLSGDGVNRPGGQDDMCVSKNSLLDKNK